MSAVWVASGKMPVKLSLISLAVVVMGLSAQAEAADIHVGGDTVCPTRAAGESFGKFRGRTHDICEVRWRALGPGATGSHDIYITVCTKKCYAEVGQQSVASQTNAAIGNQLATTSTYVGAGGFAGLAAVSGITASQYPASP